MANETQTLILTLPQVIDAALTGPEMGIVSFRLLNNILQVLCQQLDLEGVKVQYQGMQAMQIQKIWNPEIKSKMPQITTVKRTKLISADENEEETIVVIPDGPSERFPAMTLAISNTQLQTMERNIRGLQKEVSDLKSLPSNNELFKAVKSKSGEPSPIVDMYQLLSVTKRMDATEEAVVKIASFVEDLARYVQSEDYPALSEDLDSATDKQQARKESVYVDRRQSRVKIVPGQSREFGSPGTGAVSDSFPHEGEKLKKSTSGAKYPRPLDIGALGRQASSLIKTEKLEHPVVTIKGNIGEDGFTEKRIKDRTSIRDSTASNSSSKNVSGYSLKLPESKLKGVNTNTMSNRDVLALIQEELKTLRSTVEDLCNMASPGERMSINNPPILGQLPLGPLPLGPLPMGPLPLGSDVPSIASPRGSHTASVHQTSDERICQVETRINQCVAQINKMDSIFSSSYSGITNRMAEIESSLKVLSNKALQDIARADLEEQLTQNMFSLNEKETTIESTLTKLSEAMAALIEENNAKQNKLMSLVDDVGNLKSDKIGREEFTEALAEKVDICMINRKVSHDQFNATCDDLSRGIEEALEKLMEQEDLWHIALKEIQEEISEKLSKDDLTPLREFVSDKLKGLQHKVRTLTRMKQQQEAAATKSKFLTGVQCISCDKDVVMRKKVDESVDYPGATMFPPTKNMAPYLAYELDQLRKQQRQMQFGKNLNHFETATKDSKGVVNRYCGGSHTITTPQQRVTRIGNFMEIWGPKSLQMERESLHGQSDRSNKDDITKKPGEPSNPNGSRESLAIKNIMKFDRAEKDGTDETLRKSIDEDMIK